MVVTGFLRNAVIGLLLVVFTTIAHAQDFDVLQISNDATKYTFVQRWNREHPKLSIYTFDQFNSWLGAPNSNYKQLTKNEALEVLSDQRILIYSYFSKNPREGQKLQLKLNYIGWLYSHWKVLRKKIPQLLLSYRTLNKLFDVADIHFTDGKEGFFTAKHDRNVFHELLVKLDPSQEGRVKERI